MRDVRSRRMDRLAETARAVALEWGLELGRPLGPSSYSYIAAVGDDAVLKVVAPEDTESDDEAAALSLWNGDHAVRLLRHDRARKALLLERAQPGTDISEMPEGDAVSIALEVGRALWRSPDSNSSFRDVLALTQRSLASLEGVEHELVPLAHAAFESLRPGTKRTLIHGDFHHHNILRHGTGWAAIDPKPALGEAEYDPAPLLWNPVGMEPTRERTERWLSAFAAAGLDRDRLRSWAIVRGVVLGLPLDPGEDEPAQLAVVRLLL